MLLNSTLQKYIVTLEKAVRSLDEAYVELYEEEVITEDRLNIRLRIRMSDDFLLELNEAVVAEEQLIRHLGYRYHFQDGQNNLIFRYDDTPHFPELSSFPHHKHLKKKVIEAKKPDLSSVIAEASDHAIAL